MTLRLLEASAGTGKTFRIADDVLRHVALGVDLRRMVVVTFTEAAGAELRGRVRARLRDARAALAGARPTDEPLAAWARGCSDPGVDARLRLALQRFDEATIGTLHGFAHRALGRWALETGTDLSSAVGSADPLLAELVHDLWSRITWDASPAVLASLRAGGVTRPLLLDLARKASDPDLRIVPEVRPAEPPDVSTWERLRAVLKQRWHARSIMAAIADADVAHRVSKSWPVSLPPGTVRDHAWAVGNDLWKLDPSGPVPACIAYFRAERLAVATKSGPVPSHPGLQALEALAVEHERVAGPLSAFVLASKRAFADEVRVRLPALLRRRHERTFDDLPRDLLRAVERDPSVRGLVRERFELALVDEFQDTDPVQWELFRTLFDGALTLVGDPKQAIYAFRGADVHTWRRATASVREPEHLGTSYRADGPLVAAVNHLFGREGLEHPFGTGWPTFRPVGAHHEGSRRLADPRPAFELRILPRVGADVWRGLLAADFLRDRLPEVVADDVVAELRRGVRIAHGSGERPVSPGDCAVLVRSNEQARAVARALRARSVPAVRRADDGVWASDVGVALSAVLSSVLEPGSDGLRRAALVTPLLGRTASDLLRLDVDGALAASTAERFHRWRSLWRDEGFGVAAAAILDDEEVVDRVLAGPGGDRRAADLRHLLELLGEGAAGGLGPQALLGWLRDGGPDPDAARLRLETDDPAVQVVTVHGAKGLEYPLVWCPFLWSGGFLSTSDKAHLLLHDADGGRVLDLGSPEHDDHLASRRQEQLEEDLRLVYVAVTRARHRCVVYFGAAATPSALGGLLGAPQGNALVYGDDAALVEALEPVTSHPQVALTAVDWERPPADAWRRAEPPAPGLRALERDLAPDRWWRRTSFTALARGGEPADPRAFVDHDGASEEVPLAGFPGGADMGTMVHEVLERHDFAAPAGLRGLLGEVLAAHGRPADEGERLAPALQGVLDASLRPGLRLAEVPSSGRVAELEFVFPRREGPLLGPRELARGFEHPDAPEGYADLVRALPFVPVRGFLVGSIDLVFRHGGLFFLVDWKTNRLGDTFGDYVRPALEREMRHAHYLLQLHLYAVALHRWLRLRIPGYAWDTHVGGAFYLFLRGMAPGRPTGIYDLRPTASLVAHLDELLAGREP